MPRPAANIRARILKVLGTVGPLTQGRLSEALGVTRSPVCSALGELLRAGEICPASPVARHCRFQGSVAYQLVTQSPPRPVEPPPHLRLLSAEDAAELAYLRRTRELGQIRQMRPVGGA